MEINPNHPVTQEVHDLWHKIAALLVYKTGNKEMTITLADLKAWERDYPDGAIVIKANNLDFRLWLATAAETEKLAREEGGLPV